MTSSEEARLDRQPTRRGFLWLCAALVTHLHSGLLLGQSGTEREIHTIYVAPLASGDPGEGLRKQVIHDLSRGGQVRLVTQADGADATLAIRAVFWRTGEIAVNPRSSQNTFATYQGYASAELYDARRQTLWSYLATPSRFSFAGLTSDLAGQLSASLLSALARGLTTAGGAATGSKTGGPALRAAGATFPAPLYLRWFESFAGQPGGFPIHYDATGSSEGLQMLAAGSIDIAASDIPPAAPEPDWLRVATVVGGVVPIYNLPGLGRDLHLNGPVLAGIYAGKIRKWNDPRIREWNKGARLPDAEITVVHRNDGSGTTFVWTSYLAAASPDWKDKIGASIEWPAGEGATGNEGVAARVQTTPNSIGYTELTYAIQHQLQYAAVRNPAGSYIQADLPSLTAAAAAAGRDQQGSLLNTPGADAYPIATFTWLLLPKTGQDAQQRAALAGFLRWMLTAGQKQCSALAYAPLPRELADEELRKVDAWK